MRVDLFSAWTLATSAGKRLKDQYRLGPGYSPNNGDRSFPGCGSSRPDRLWTFPGAILCSAHRFAVLDKRHLQSFTALPASRNGNGEWGRSSLYEVLKYVLPGRYHQCHTPCVSRLLDGQGSSDLMHTEVYYLWPSPK